MLTLDALKPFLVSKSNKNVSRLVSKNILLVVDDAYAEYMKNIDYKSGLDLFKNKQNVFILRTFSKIYGLSSLRIGWGYGSKKENLRFINETENIFKKWKMY